jgi:hypothetical protein
MKTLFITILIVINIIGQTQSTKDPIIEILSNLDNNYMHIGITYNRTDFGQDAIKNNPSIYYDNEYKQIQSKDFRIINQNWQPFNKETIKTLSVSKTEITTYKDLKFNVIWDNKLSHSDNIGYYGGIKQLTIYKKDKQINLLKNIEDGIALGVINFEIYDYNLDGHLDFTIPIDCGSVCWNSYYLFNPTTNKFEHCKDWDYLRLKEINKITKQIRNQPYGNDAIKTYQIKGLELIKI